MPHPYWYAEGPLHDRLQGSEEYRVVGTGRHVSAGTLKSPFAPANLSRGLCNNNPDAHVWNDAYDEEYDGIAGLDTFVEITEIEYRELVAEHGEAAMAIPTMNIFIVKKDKDGIPVRAKSRIVVLGNLEKRIRVPV